MAVAYLLRSAFTGLLRKSSAYRSPVVCRLATIALIRKNQTIKTLVNHQLQNEVHIRQYSSGTHSTLSLKQIEEIVMKICIEKAGLDYIEPDCRLSLHSHLRDETGLDSSDLYALLMEIEIVFDIEIDDDEAERLVTPYEIIQFIARIKDVHE